MFWMFELMAMTFVLMFSEITLVKKQNELQERRHEIIEILHDLYEKQERTQRYFDALSEHQYTIPEIKPMRNDEEKDVDKK